jgi:hypothetical protein
MATSKYELPDETLQLIANSDFANAFKSFNQNVTPSQSAGALKPDNLIKALRDATKAGPGNPGVNLLANRANGKPLTTREYQNQLFYPKILKMAPYIKPDVVLPKAETQLPYVPPYVPPIVDDVVIKKLGDDVVSDDDDVDTGVATTIVGGTGNDTIVGGTGNDDVVVDDDVVDDVADDGTTDGILDVINSLTLNTITTDTDKKDTSYLEADGDDTVFGGGVTDTTNNDTLEVADDGTTDGILDVINSLNDSTEKEDKSTLEAEGDDTVFGGSAADTTNNDTLVAADDGTTNDIQDVIDSLESVDFGDFGGNGTNTTINDTLEVADDGTTNDIQDVINSLDGYDFGNFGGGGGGGGGGGKGNIDYYDVAEYNKGGKVTPDRLMGPDPAGPDDGFAALKSGEFVLNEKAAKEIGYEVLKRLNARNR